MVREDKKLAITFDELCRKFANRELVEVPILAKKINRSEETIRRWIRDGNLKGYKIGGRWFIERKSLASFLRSTHQLPQEVEEA